jgi:hypothetical protein
MFAPVICEAASVQRKTASAATWSRAKNIMPWTTGNAQQSRSGKREGGCLLLRVEYCVAPC